MSVNANQPNRPAVDQTGGLAASERSGAYLPALGGLRALAALAVFGVHLQQITGLTGQAGPFDLGRLLANGNSGVCLFFMLSGFLLSLPFWLNGGWWMTFGASAVTGQRRRWIVRYAWRRVGRIVPAYFLCLTALVMWEGAWTSSKGILSAGLHYVFLHNMAAFSLYDFSPPFWTLAVQAQFYVLFPLLMLTLGPLFRATRPAVTVLAFLTAAAYALHVFVADLLGGLADSGVIPSALIAPDGFVVEHTLLAHLPHFLLGMVAAGLFLAGKNKPDGGIVYDTLFLLAATALIIALAIPQLDEWLTVPHGRYHLPYVPLLLGVMIISAPRSRVAGSGLSYAPVAWVGMVSYGVYVYHLPVMTLITRIMGTAGLSPATNWPLFGFFSLAATLLVAAISYYWLEQPVLRWLSPRATHPTRSGSGS